MTNRKLVALPSRGATGQIRSVQLLRAIAALFVVGFHSTVLWHDRFDATVRPWDNGNSGVDLFFVISGFIMVLSSRRLLGLADGWRRFIVLRLIRIVPMYWLTTAGKLAAVAVFPTVALHTRPTGWNIVASFLFIPSRDALGIIRPVLDVGWTLSFEMLFYATFAAAMFLAFDPLVVVGPAMIILALAYLATNPLWPAVTSLADPIVLEFVFGILVGRVVMRNQPRPAYAGWLLMVVVGIAGLAIAPVAGRWERVAIWGVAATAALYGSVLGEKWIGRHIPDLAVKLGEASYSLYLTHGFVLPVIGMAMARSGLSGLALGAALVSCCLIVSTLVSLLAYRFIEVPVTTWLRKAAHDRGSPSLAAPESAI